MKKLTLIFACILAVLAASAQSSQGFDRMILKFTDGSVEEFSLSEDVVVIPDIDIVEIHTAGYIYIPTTVTICRQSYTMSPSPGSKTSPSKRTTQYASTMTTWCRSMAYIPTMWCWCIRQTDA